LGSASSVGPTAASRAKVPADKRSPAQGRDKINADGLLGVVTRSEARSTATKFPRVSSSCLRQRETPGWRLLSVHWRLEIPL